MTITLRIDNCDSLADGGPLTFSARNRTFEIGRETHLDWTLPDPNRVISGRHCEVRFDNGGYWLNDVSRNGTFINGSSARVKSPYRLTDGDRIQIGHYLISVAVAAGDAADAFDADDRSAPFGNGSVGAGPSSENGIWDTGAPAPAPISRRDLMPPPKRARQDVDFAEQYLELPELRSSPAFDAFAASPQQVAPPQPAPQPPAYAPPPRPPYAPPPDAFAPAPAASPFAAPVPAAPVFTPSPTPIAPQDPGFGARPAPVPGGSPFFVESEPFAPKPRQVAPLPPVQSSQAFAPPASPPMQMPTPHYAQPQPQAAPPMQPQAYAPPAAPLPQAYAPPVAAAPQAYAGGARGGADVMARLAKGAGISADAFAQRDPGDVAEEVGEVLRVTVEELAQLLKARAAAKVMARSSNRTMISAVDNNPLKFIPRPDEVIEIMFARRRAGYLDAKRSIEESFVDLKTHEFATYAAMQKALARLLEEFAPDTIEKKISSSAFASRKGRAWDTYVAQWEARTVGSENGLLDVFLTYFAEAYEKASKKG